MSRKSEKGGSMLKGQIALVTGSTQGIGAGIARKMAAHGARVVVHGLKEDGKTLRSIREAGGEGFLVAGDLKRESFCRMLIRQTLEHFGKLDILVNNAGVFFRSNIENTTTELWDDIFKVNLRAPFILCQEAVKHMKGRRSGCIINIGSLNAYIGDRKLMAYSASKGGLMTFTKNLADYLTQYRIRVNQINPGWVFTEGEDYTQNVIEGKGMHWLKDAVKTRPFGRMLSPDDIAEAALFLATAEVITGSVLDYEQGPVGAMPAT